MHIRHEALIILPAFIRYIEAKTSSMSQLRTEMNELYIYFWFKRMNLLGIKQF